MNEINIKELKETISQIVDKILDDDIKKGRNLIQLCEEYEIINKSNYRYICEIQGHRQQVVNFIRQIIPRYSNLIKFYNNLNVFSYSNNNYNNQIECTTIRSYVDFLEMAKMLKNNIDKISNYDELTNVLKYKNNKL